DAVGRYVADARQRSDLERQADTRAKSGVFTGTYAVNPVNGEPIPVFVADYVLMGYGTGAIMAVPAHDERDFDFARTFDLPIVGVVEPDADWFDTHGIAVKTPANSWPAAFMGDGRIVNSANDDISIDDLAVPEAISRITTWLVEIGLGVEQVQYKLRDWLFSRQRYWGEPFPIVFGDDGEP